MKATKTMPRKPATAKATPKRPLAVRHTREVTAVLASLLDTAVTVDRAQDDAVQALLSHGFIDERRAGKLRALERQGLLVLSPVELTWQQRGKLRTKPPRTCILYAVELTAEGRAIGERRKEEDRRAAAERSERAGRQMERVIDHETRLRFGLNATKAERRIVAEEAARAMAHGY